MPKFNLINEQSATSMKLQQTLLSVSSRTTLAILVALSLSACGDSDLADLQAKSIEAAIQAAAAQSENPLIDSDTPLIGEGNEDSDAPLPGGDPAPSAATEQAITVGDYELVFHDEFAGTSLDTTKWNTSMAWGPDLVINNELQYYVDTTANPDAAFDPFQFDGEAVVITAVKTPQAMADSTNGQEYVSGALTTTNKLDITYGYIEARVDLPAGTGLWPAMWMVSSEFKDLKPQLFMMEYNGANENSVYHNYNFTDENGDLRSAQQHEVTVENASDGWQTIGVRWSVGELVYYVNGVPTFKVEGDSVSAQAMYLILNMAVGGTWVGEPDSTTPVPAEFKVDYVRVYQAK